LDEPVAAAQAWLAGSGQEIADSVIVCDVGGGTTDFALVRRANGQFQTDDRVAPTGLDLGGNDVDRNIWDDWVSEQQSDSSALECLSSGFLIKLRCIRERLGLDRQQQLSATLGKQTLQIRRAVFEQDVEAFVGKVVNETCRYTNRCISAGTGKVPILLVGGGAQFPGLKISLEQALKQLDVGPVYLWNDSEYATVLGAVPGPLTTPPSPPLPQKSQHEEAIGRRDAIRASDEPPSHSKTPEAKQKYREAVEACWADNQIQPAEADYLRKRQKELGISANEAGDIEVSVMGASLEKVLQGQQEREHITLEESNLNSVSDSLQRGQQFLDAGEPNAALLDFSHVLSQVPNHVDALNRRSLCYILLARIPEAQRDCNRAWDLEPSNLCAKTYASYCTICTGLAGVNQPLAGIYVWPFPEDKRYKVNNAHASYIGPFYHDPSPSTLLLYDDTFLGRAKNGLCLCEEAVYWKRGAETQCFFKKYGFIQSVKAGEGNLKIDGATVIEGVFTNQNCLPLLERVLVRLAELHRLHMVSS
jgi:tetratricopeptide (TPR) repeat protein